MGEEVLFYKILPCLIYILAAILSIVSGLLVYYGVSSQSDRIQTRLRLRHSIQMNTYKFSKNAEKSKGETWLRKAGYPLGLNGITYQIVFIILFIFLVGYYVLIPLIFMGKFNVVAFCIILLGVFILIPSNPFSLFVFVMKRVIDYQNSRRNGEIFMLYDLLINELEMMHAIRINAYNLLRNMLPYFKVIKPNIATMLSVWSNDEGPEKALDMFAEEIDTREAKSLVSVIKTLDKVDRETAIQSLQNMHNMFSRSQIENYRRRRKVSTDLMGIPIKVTHFLIILNFIFIIIAMVMKVINGNRFF